MRTAEPSARLLPLFTDYQAFHRTRGNQACHLVAVPLIMIAVFGLMALGDASGWLGLPSAALFRPDAGLALLVAAVCWFLYLDWHVAIPFAVTSAGLYLLGRSLPLSTLWALFIGGWIIQFIGHGMYEHNRPAFMKNVKHFLIGPLWVFAKCVGYWSEGPGPGA